MQTWFAVSMCLNRSSCIKMFFCACVCLYRMTKDPVLCVWVRAGPFVPESGYVMFSSGLGWWHTYVLGRWVGAGHTTTTASQHHNSIQWPALRAAQQQQQHSTHFRPSPTFCSFAKRINLLTCLQKWGSNKNFLLMLFNRIYDSAMQQTKCSLIYMMLLKFWD